MDVHGARPFTPVDTISKHASLPGLTQTEETPLGTQAPTHAFTLLNHFPLPFTVSETISSVYDAQSEKDLFVEHSVTPLGRLKVSPVTHAATGSAKLVKVASFLHLGNARKLTVRG